MFPAVEEQLHILAQAPDAFLQCDRLLNQWLVDKDNCNSCLLQNEIVRYIRVRFGSMALRVIRILFDRGKVDERKLQEIGLFPAKELRQLLSEMKSCGLVKLQEVPREPQRQPNRTMFFWYVDGEEARQAILDCTYKAMSRLLQCISKERRNIRSTLEKVERNDVRGKEELVLPPFELNTLRRFQKREHRLWVEIERLDDTVALLEG